MRLPVLDTDGTDRPSERFALYVDGVLLGCYPEYHRASEAGAAFAFAIGGDHTVKVVDLDEGEPAMKPTVESVRVLTIPTRQEGAAMIRDRTARRIACDWHGGGGSALYALCSTGAIDTARWDHDANGEVLDAYEDHLPAKDKRDLANLSAYIRAHQPRGPVDGWGRMPW